MQHKTEVMEGKLCLSVSAIAEAMSNETEGDFFDNADQYIRRVLAGNRKGELKSWAHYTDEEDRRRVWIVYEKLATQTREKVEKYYGDVQALRQREVLVAIALSELDPADADYFLMTGHYTSEQTRGLIEAAAWCRILSIHDWWKEWLGLPKTPAMAVVAKIIGERNLYNFKVKNGVGLYRKLNAWEQTGLRSLENKSIGNTNGCKGMDTGKRELMMDRLFDLYGNPLKPNVDKVAQIYNDEAAQFGWEKLTRQRIHQILFKVGNVIKWYAGRHGHLKAREKFENTLKGKEVKYADEIWSWDGTTVQLYMDDEGKLNKPIYRVTVSDAFSKAIIGEAFGETETADVCIEALRVAIEYGGYVPKIIQYDGGIGKMKKVKTVLEKLNLLGIKSQPYNGKSKFVEPVQGAKEQQIMRFYGNFVGGNVTGKSLNAKANPDRIKLLHKEKGLPTTRRGVIFQDLIATVIYNNTIIKKYNMTPLDRYMMEDDRRKKVTASMNAKAFWTATERTIVYDEKGLRLRVGEQDLNYVVESEESGLECQDFRLNHFGQSFIVRYHLDDMEKVQLYDVEDKYIATANRKYEYDRVPTIGQGSQLRSALDQRTDFFKKQERERRERNGNLRQIGVPELDFQLAHKDALNRSGLDLEKEQIEAMGFEVLPTRKAKRLSINGVDSQEIDDDKSIFDVDEELVKSLLQD